METIKQEKKSLFECIAFPAHFFVAQLNYSMLVRFFMSMEEDFISNDFFIRIFENIDRLAFHLIFTALGWKLSIGFLYPRNELQKKLTLLFWFLFVFSNLKFLFL